MSTNLHHFCLFALNRFFEAQQGIKRSLATVSILCVSLFFVQGASADYTWMPYGGGLHATPQSACDRIIYVRQDAFKDIRLYAFVSLNYVSDVEFRCHWKYTNISPYSIYYGRVAFESQAIERRGTPCSDGKTYNPQTGVCESPPAICSVVTGECERNAQKGPPPNSCDAAPKAPTGFFGNPINSANGNKYQAEADYSAGASSTLNFTRAYNSLDGLWRHNYATHLRFAGTSVALVMGHGRESYFTVSGSTITAPATELGVLVKVADGWVYTAKNNERFTFDAAGRLTQWANTSGAQHLLAYANGVVTVTDHLGRSLSFTEDAQHQPLSLTTDGLQITYGYNAAKRLTQLTRTRDGQTEQRQFHYEDPRNTALLTGITDERGVRYATWSYDDQGRAITSEHAGGAEHTQVAYNADGSSTVTNELGKRTVYRFVSIGGVKRVSAIEGEPSANCPNSNSTFTYDTRGLLKTKTDNRGFVTTFDYNARGLEESRTEAFGTPEARTVTTTWHPTLNLRATVSEPARITTYHYDEQGRSTGQTVTER